MEDSVRGLTFLFNILIALAQDITPNIYCNNKHQTWTEARGECLKAQGGLVSYHTGLGIDVADISLNSDADVWTADYATNGGSARKLDVFESTRDNVDVRCKTTINTDDILNNLESIIPGYYWISDIFKMATELASTMHDIKCNLGASFLFIKDRKCTASGQSTYPTPDYCGAYSKKIGKYYVDCASNRSSLCHISSNQFTNTFDKRCFNHVTKPSTQSTSSKTASSTSHNTQLTSTSLNTAATLVENIGTSSVDEITSVSAMPVHTVTHYRWTTAYGGGKEEKTEGNNQSLGVSVGLPVGLCITLICGTILGIFVLRRYRCWKTQGRESGTKDVVSWNNISSTRQNVSRFNKHNEKNAVNIFDQTATNDEPTQKKENVYTNSFPEYAVVHKNNIKQMSRDQKDNSKGKKTGSVHNSEMNGNSSYCYAEFGNKNIQLANSNGIQTSEYSFAKEDTDDISEKQAAVKEDEYDVTSSKPSYKTSDNIYNKLQKENYYSDTNVSRGGNSQNQVSESVYDSTANQNCPSGPTDNTYNHLSQDTYSDVSTRNEDNIQQSMLTDQTYDKLK